MLRLVFDTAALHSRSRQNGRKLDLQERLAFHCAKTPNAKNTP
jgi:hypothetical protein